ncbi:MAG: hypothetical protein KKC77_19560 [Proteobacteria bacterium]|nr:hypothetical protein [Pseudomonadota bacterium]
MQPVERRSSDTKLALLLQETEHIKQTVDKLENLISNHYITRNEFEPVKKIVYGMVCVILTAVIVSLIALVVKQ